MSAGRVSPRAAATILALVAIAAGCINTPGRADDVELRINCAIDNWAIDECVALASPNASPSKTEIDIVVNPIDANNVVAAAKDNDREASGCVWSVAYVTRDGGKSWKTSYVGGKRAEREPGDPLFGWGCVTDPIMAFTKDGTLFYGVQAYNYGASQNALVPPVDEVSSGSAFYLARSRDGGETWDRIILLHAGEGNAIFHDYPRMAASPKTGSVFVIWNQISANAVAVPVVAGSRDGGKSAMQPVYIPSTDEPGGVGINGFAISENGTLYVTLGTFGGPNIYLTKSYDDGRSFTRPVRIMSDVSEIRNPPPNAQYRANTFVELAIDNSYGPKRGCLYAVWADGRLGNADILSRRSCDGGSSWTSAVRINPEPNKHDQFMPRVTTDEHGYVHVGYLTRSYNKDNRLLDAEYATSRDGDAWATVRLTRKSFDGNLGIHQDGFSFIGDYIGIAAAERRAYIGYPHTGSGVAEVAVSRVDRL